MSHFILGVALQIITCPPPLTQGRLAAAAGLGIAKAFWNPQPRWGFSYTINAQPDEYGWALQTVIVVTMTVFIMRVSHNAP